MMSGGSFGELFFLVGEVREIYYNLTKNDRAGGKGFLGQVFNEIIGLVVEVGGVLN